MKKDWRIYAKNADFNALSKRFGINPVTARIIRNRDIETPEEMERYLYGTLDSCFDPEIMTDMELGADIIMSAIETGDSIRVVGDYDVDGVMSTYILYDALKKAGANVTYDIPHRVIDGYGINERIIMQAYQDGVDVIITCDNGIAAVDAINKAVELGMTVVVTDHHEIPPVLPEADAIIDPHQMEDAYPYKDICGALVSYKFISVLYKMMELPFDRRMYLEYVAAATVCDVMPLLSENRIYVREGLRRMSQTENMGLRALLNINQLANKTLTAYHMGFVIGPCINAAGRLGSAKEAMSLLLSDNEEDANRLAATLKEMNDSRKSMTENGEKNVVAELSKSMKEVDGEEIPEDSVLVIYVPGLHESLAGIVAGRIKERYYRPTIIFTDSEKDETVLKGSGRSIDAYNMFEKIGEQGELLVKFGGHPLAAGLTIKKDKLELFRKELNQNSGLTEKDMTPKLMIDVPMPTGYATMKLAEELEALEPFGKGNEYPMFAEKDLEVLGYNIYGQNRNVMKLRVRSSRGNVAEMIYFRPDEFENNIKKWFTTDVCDKMVKGVYSGAKLDIAYELGINEYNGVRSLQFVIKEYDVSSTGSN